jgi:hypothetical protein
MAIFYRGFSTFGIFGGRGLSAFADSTFNESTFATCIHERGYSQKIGDYRQLKCLPKIVKKL